MSDYAFELAGKLLAGRPLDDDIELGVGLQAGDPELDYEREFQLALRKPKRRPVVDVQEEDPEEELGRIENGVDLGFPPLLDRRIPTTDEELGVSNYFGERYAMNQFEQENPLPARTTQPPTYFQRVLADVNRRSPDATAGRIIKGAGATASGVVMDVAETLAGNPTGFENTRAGLLGIPQPTKEKIEELDFGPAKVMANVSNAISDMLPAIVVSGGVGGAFEAAGADALAAHSAGAGLVFGLDENGWDPKRGAIMAAFPAVSKLGAVAMKSALGKMGVEFASKAAQKAADTIGGLVASQAYMEATNLPEYAEMTPDQRWQHFIEGLGVNLAFHLAQVPGIAAAGYSEAQIKRNIDPIVNELPHPEVATKAKAKGPRSVLSPATPKLDEALTRGEFKPADPVESISKQEAFTVFQKDGKWFIKDHKNNKSFTPSDGDTEADAVKNASQLNDSAKFWHELEGRHTPEEMAMTEEEFEEEKIKRNERAIKDILDNWGGSKHSNKLVQEAVKNARKNGITPEFRALFAGIEPEIAGTTNEKVAEYAKTLGLEWRPTITKPAARPQVAPVTYAGFFPGTEKRPGYHQFNLTEDLSPELVKGSTVSENTLRKAGFGIPDGIIPAGEPKAPEPQTPRPAVDVAPAPPDVTTMSDEELLAALQGQTSKVVAKKARNKKVVAEEVAADARPETKTKRFFKPEEQAGLDAIAARRAARKKGGTVNSTLIPGVDPMTFEDAQDVAAILIKAGVRNFAEFTTRMRDTIGDEVIPALRAVYAKAVGKLSDVDSRHATKVEKEHFANVIVPSLSALPKDQLFENLSKASGQELLTLLKKIPVPSDMDKTASVPDMPDMASFPVEKRAKAIDSFHKSDAGIKRNSVIATIAEKLAKVEAPAAKVKASALPDLDGTALTHEHVDFDNTVVASGAEKKNQATEPPYFQISQRELLRNPDAVVSKILSGDRSGKQTEKTQRTRRVVGIQDNDTGKVYLASVYENRNATVKGVSKARKTTSLERAFVADPEKFLAGKSNTNTDLATLLKVTGANGPRYRLLDSARLKGTVDGHLQEFPNRQVYDAVFGKPATSALESAKTGAEAMESKIAEGGLKRPIGAEDEAVVHAENLESGVVQAGEPVADLRDHVAKAEPEELTEPDTGEKVDDLADPEQVDALAEIPMEEVVSDPRNSLTKNHAQTLVDTLETIAEKEYGTTLGESLGTIDSFTDLMQDAFDQNRTVVDAAKKIAKALLNKKIARNADDAARGTIEHLYEIFAKTYGTGKETTVDGILRTFGEEDSSGEHPAKKPSKSEAAIRWLDEKKRILNSRGAARMNFFGGLDVGTANLVIDLVKVAIKGGNAIADAVDMGIEWLKDTKASFDEAKVRAAFDELLTREKVTQAGETSIAQLAEPMITDVKKRAERIIGKTTNKARLEQRSASKVLRRPDVKRNFIAPLETLQTSVETIGRKLTDWEISQSDTTLSPEAKSAATGKALYALDQFESDNRDFVTRYADERKRLADTVDQAIEAKVEASSHTAAINTLMEEFVDLLNHSIGAESSAKTITNLRTLMSRMGGVKNIMDFLLRKGVPLEDMVSFGLTDRAKIVAELEKAAGEKMGTPEFRQAIGAPEETANLFIDFLLNNQELRDNLATAKQLVEDKSIAGKVSSIKLAIAAAVKAGKIDEAIDIFSNGIGKTAAEREQSAKAARFFGSVQRRALTDIAALDEVKKLFGSVTSQKAYQEMRSRVLETLNVSDIIRGPTSTSYKLLEIPGTEQKELVIRTNTDKAIFDEDKQALAEYNAAALDYLTDTEAPHYSETRARALKEWLNQSDLWMQDADPVLGRRLPGPLALPIRWIGRLIGGADQVPNFIANYGAGNAFNYFNRSLAAFSTAQEVARDLLERKYRSPLKLALDQALKSHDGMSVEEFRKKVWNPFVGSQQYFSNLRHLTVGDNIGNGHKVTKADVALLSMYRAMQKDITGKLQATDPTAAAVKNFRAGVIEKDAAGQKRIRAWAETGPGTADRHWGRVKNQHAEWLGSKDREGFFNRYLELLHGYVGAVAEPELKHTYVFSTELKNVLQHDDVPTDVQHLAEMVAERYNDGREPGDQKSVDDVKKQLMEELNSIMGRVDKYNDIDEKLKNEKSIGFFYGGENAANTARGEQILPSAWYDYGALTDGELSGFISSGTNKFTIEHLHATELLKRELDRVVDELEAQPKEKGTDFYSLGQAKVAKEQVGLYLDNLRAATAFTKRAGLAAESAADVANQVATASVLSSPSPNIGNLFGGYFQYLLEASAIRNQGMYRAIPAEFAKLTWYGAKNILRVLASDSNATGRRVAKLLNSPAARTLTLNVSKAVADIAEAEHRYYNEMREAGIAGSVPQFLNDDIKAMLAFGGTGGVARPDKARNIGSRILGGAYTGVKVGAKILHAGTMAQGDLFLNVMAARAASELESSIQARVIKGFKARGSSDIPLTNKELVNGWSDGTGVDAAAARMKERLRRSEINVDEQAKDFWARYKLAEAKEVAEGVEAGTYTSKERLLNEAQRQQLRLSTAEDNNLSTFGSRPIKARGDAGYRRIFQFFGYPIAAATRFYHMASRLNTSGARGVGALLPQVLSMVILAAAAGTMSQSAIEWAKRKIQHKESGVPTLLDWNSSSGKERALSFARGAAMMLPGYGTLYNQFTDSAYRNGFDLNSQFFQLNLAASALGTIKEIAQTRSVVYPALKFADRYVFPANYLAPYLPQFEGIREGQNVGNIIRKAARENNLDEQFREPFTGSVKYTPATPIMDAFVNAVGKNDIDGARKQFDKLVALKMEDGTDEKAARKAATIALQGRNPINKIFKHKPDDAEMDRLLSKQSPENQARVRKYMESFKDAMIESGVKPGPARTRKGSNIFGESRATSPSLSAGASLGYSPRSSSRLSALRPRVSSRRKSRLSGSRSTSRRSSISRITRRPTLKRLKVARIKSPRIARTKLRRRRISLA